MPADTPESLPPYSDLIYPPLKAVDALGGSAQTSEIRDRVLDDLAVSNEMVAITYPNRDKSVLLDRLDWARSYAKLSGALDSPKRGLSSSAPSAKRYSTCPKTRLVIECRS